MLGEWLLRLGWWLRLEGWCWCCEGGSEGGRREAGGEGREVLARMENVIDPRLFKVKVGHFTLL